MKLDLAAHLVREKNYTADPAQPAHRPRRFFPPELSFLQVFAPDPFWAFGFELALVDELTLPFSKILDASNSRKIFHA
jgi:hypothetical protein